MIFSSLIGEFGGDFFFMYFFVICVVEVDGFYFEQVDYVLKVVFGFDWNLYQSCISFQFVVNLIENFERIGICLIYFVDEC